MISLASLPDSTITHPMGLFKINSQIIIEYRVQSLCCYNFVIGIETGNTLLEISLDSDNVDSLEIIEAYDSDAMALKEVVIAPKDDSYHRFILSGDEGLSLDGKKVSEIGSRLFRAHYATPYVVLTSKDNIEKKISINVYSI